MQNFINKTEELFYKENIKVSVDSHLKLIKSRENKEYNDLYDDVKNNDYFFEVLYQTYTKTNSGEYFTPDTIIQYLKNYLGDVSNLSIVDYAAGVGTLINQLKSDNKACVELKEESSQISSFRGFKTYNDNAFNHSEQYDLAVINPPYSLKEYTEFDFINHALKHCDRVVAIVPLGVLFRDNMKSSRENIIKNIKTVILLPSNTFLTTGIPVCILDITKESHEKVKMVDLSECFDKVGKKNIIKKEVYDYHNEEIEGFSEYIDVETLVENDFNLSVTRYVYKEEGAEYIDIDVLNDEISDLYTAIIATNKSVLDMLKG